jgi:hypothetical protein
MFDKRRAKFLIEQELDLFPKATLTDFYKLFYQNCCGSQHYLQDLNFIKNRILSEIQDIEEKCFIYPTYDISYRLKVSRISLYSIKVGKYDISFIADAFYKLAIDPNRLKCQAWLAEWEKIQELIFNLKPAIFDDLTSKDISQGQALHHSDIYRLNYHPHYRICSI